MHYQQYFKNLVKNMNGRRNRYRILGVARKYSSAQYILKHKKFYR